jgi:hypothetical protein
MKRTITIITAIFIAFGAFAANFDVESVATDYSKFEVAEQVTATTFSSFSIPSQVSSTINTEDHTIQVWMGEVTDFTTLVPTFTVEEGAVVYAGSTQVSSTITELDFSAPLTLSVNYGEESQNWVVTVSSGTTIRTQDALEISVYPNPTADYVTIEGGENAMVVVYNILGKVVMTETNLQNGRLDLSALTRGNYIVSVVKEGQRATKKVTKL